MDEPSLPNEPSPGGRVLRLEADRWREGSKVPLQGAGLSISPSSSPLTSFGSCPLQSVIQVPQASKGPQEVTFLFSFLVQVFIISYVGSCNNPLHLILLPQFPPSSSLHPMPPPRSQGTSLTQLLYTHIEKARLFMPP